jgi:hypothetical protein
MESEMTKRRIYLLALLCAVAWCLFCYWLFGVSDTATIPTLSPFRLAMHQKLFLAGVALMGAVLWLVRYLSRRGGDNFMRFLRNLLAGCTHRSLTFPRSARQSQNKNTYVVCLGCGARFAYDWQAMKQGARIDS